MSKNTKTATFNIGSDFSEYIKNLVSSGDYTNSSEVVRDALRIHKRENIRKTAIEAIRSLVSGITEEDLILDKTLEEVLEEAWHKNQK